MADFKYETKVFSGPVKEDVSDQVNSWLNAREGQIEVVSSNMVAYNDPGDNYRLNFSVYCLFIQFPNLD